MHSKLAYFKQYGEYPLSYSIAFEEDFKRFKYKGILAYWSSENLNLIIGDPLADKGDYGLILDRFLEFSYDNKKRVIAVQIHRDFAKEFSQRGFYINEMGVETDIFIKKFSIKGKHRTKFRRWINTAKNSGIIVKENRFSDISEHDLNLINEEWIKTRQNKEELNILVRKAKFIDEPLTKSYFAYLNDELIGFVVYDPMYKNNRLIGYYADIIRYKKSSPNGTIDLINFTAMNDFKENAEILSLGLSPLAEIEYLKNSNYLTYWIFKFIHRYGERLYSFKGLDFHKKAYYSESQAKREKVYYASKNLLDIGNLIEGFQEINILPRGNKIKAIYSMTKKIIGSFYNVKDKRRP